MEHQAKTSGRAAFTLAVAGLMAAGISYGGVAKAAGGRVIQFQEHATNLNYIAIGSLFGKPPPAQGDYIAFDDPLFDTMTNAPVGQVLGQCTLVNVNAQTFLCFVTVYLKGRGTLAFQGGFGPSGTIGSSPVTGGTGQFRGTLGEASIKVLNGGAINAWAIRLDS